MKNIIIGVIALVLVAAGGWYVWSMNFSGPQMVWDNADGDMIIIDNISPGVTVLPNFSVYGKARGMWYFEASFPVEILDNTGKPIAITPAQAQGEWMTEEFVPFSAELKIEGGYSGPATLVLHKDNASGLPEHDASVSIPIVIQ